MRKLQNNTGLFDSNLVRFTRTRALITRHFVIAFNDSQL